MYFTQEDYIKIENWLQANSVKDTEFPEASNLSLNEQLTIIQRGENKRIKLEDLVSFLLSQSDSELDVQSTNPVQNQAVARAIYELQNRKFIEIVEELPPISNAKDSVVYILLDEVGEDNNLFTEWIKVNNTWEKVGEFKAEIDLSPYLKIQDSPFEKGEAENSAVLKGGNNQATNVNEAAFGRLNKSNENTRFSIGIGTSNINRKNAHEIMDDGRHYIYGIGGYDGTNSVTPNAQGIIAKSVQEVINDNFGGIIIVEHSDTLSKNYVIDVYNKISYAILSGKMYTIYVDNKTDNTIYGNVQVSAIGSNNVHLSHTIMYPDGSVYIHRHTYHANGHYEFVKGTYNLKKISELETKLNEITTND